MVVRAGDIMSKGRKKGYLEAEEAGQE